jgi:hypothetical protein
MKNAVLGLQHLKKKELLYGMMLSCSCRIHRDRYVLQVDRLSNLKKTTCCSFGAIPHSFQCQDSNATWREIHVDGNLTISQRPRILLITDDFALLDFWIRNIPAQISQRIPFSHPPPFTSLHYFYEIRPPSVYVNIRLIILRRCEYLPPIEISKLATTRARLRGANHHLHDH